MEDLITKGSEKKLKPKIWNDITNILAKLAGSKDYDPKVKYDTSLEYYGNQIPVLPNPGTTNTGKVVAAKADGTYELKAISAGDSNAVHYTADTGKTSAEKEQARNNIAAETKKIIVNVTYSDEVYSADKTFAEISQAIENGASAFVWYYGLYIPMLTYDESGEVTFAVVQDNSYYSFLLENDGEVDSWYSDQIEFQSAEKTVTDLVSSSITISRTVSNTIYNYGELTSLTVSAIPPVADFIIRFTSGSTPTTTSFPVSMKFPEAFAAEASTRYEISVSNGYALVASWPVS